MKPTEISFRIIDMSKDHIYLIFISVIDGKQGNVEEC